MGSGLGWPQRDFLVMVEKYQMGDRFRGLNVGILAAISVLSGTLLTFQPCNVKNKDTHHGPWHTVSMVGLGWLKMQGKT